MTTPIPEAAVEAAARAAYESLDTLPGGIGGQTLRESWDSISARLREQCVVSTRAALTAARPLMEAEAWDEGADAMLSAYDGDGWGPIPPNPHRAATIAERTHDDTA